MGREWAPGDVAMWENERIFREGYNDNRDGARWIGAHNGECWPEPFDDVRPLVVLDSEDAERVQLLAGLFCEQPDCLRNPGEALQAALREFADPTPPKPVEPTGLGAVVEDTDGRRWVRDEAGHRGQRSWYLRGEANCSPFGNLRAVRVLSEGVSS